MILALCMAVLCGLNAACVVTDVVHHHPWMVFANAPAAAVCFVSAMRR